MKARSRISPKAFQDATIRAALSALEDRNGARRFLVADEPGLGKTVVARGVIEAMCQERRRRPRPLVVLYVCSNQAIAAQNVKSLASFLDPDDPHSPRALVDRPGLIPLKGRPAHPRLHIYSVTPDTAYAPEKRRSRGTVRERALACAAIELNSRRISPILREALAWKIDEFDTQVDRCKQVLRDRKAEWDVDAFLARFEALLRTVSGAPEHTGPGLLRFLEDIAHGEHWKTLTYHARNCLAAAALASLKADLIIFDEFQKFRRLMRAQARTTGDAAQIAVVNALTARHSAARLLMLSATPYESQAYQSDRKIAGENNDFFDVLAFLHDNLPDSEREERVTRIKVLFHNLELALRRGEPRSPTAVAERHELVQLLRFVMCRTERPFQQKIRIDADASDESDNLTTREVEAFGDFAQFLHSDDTHWAVPLWSSVPLPQQMLGTRYKCWERGRCRKVDSKLRISDVKGWRAPRDWGNFKVRKLLQRLPVSSLARPWVNPSLEWWPLHGAWTPAPESTTQDESQSVDGKLLVFGRFSAVPGAISGILSFNLETGIREKYRRARKTTSYSKWTRPVLSAGVTDPDVFTLFFPSSLLAALDPLKDGIPGTVDAARVQILEQLREILRERSIKVTTRPRRRMLPSHVLLIALTAKEEWTRARATWKDVLYRFSSSQRVSEETVERGIASWERRALKERITEMHPGELERLVDLALKSPAVVLARSLCRHWSNVFSDEPLKAGAWTGTGRELIQEFALFGLRRYLDKRWFVDALAASPKSPAASVLANAVVAGNLEAVLDEHFWLLERTNSDSWPERVRALQKTLSLSSGRTVFHETGRERKTGRIRCHVAMPLHEPKVAEADSSEREGEEGDEANRPDQVRHAFNTPFWPMVLTTTSIGQEGLDFHLWCRAIGHWDPAKGPVELEQREGRIDRYVCLAVRRALASKLKHSTHAETGSAWRAIETAAGRCEDESQMSPWWTFEGAQTQQLYFGATGSREIELQRRLERGRAIYRVLLGMPDARSLLEELSSGTLTEESAANAALDLRAWKPTQGGTAGGRPGE